MATTLSHKTARILTPLSLLYNLASQTYGILHNPSTLDIHNSHLSFFSPAPASIALIFTLYLLLQALYLIYLLRLPTSPTTTSNSGFGSASTALTHLLPYTPVYILANVCLGTWTFFWVTDHLALADLFVALNFLAHLWFVSTQLPRMNTHSRPSITIHILSKTALGLAGLDLLHNTSIAFFEGWHAGVVVRVLTGLGVLVVCMGCDWILGGVVVYALVGLSVGQAEYAVGEGWGRLLGVYALGAVVLVGGKNYLRPPYDSQGEGYVEAAQEEGDERT